MRAEIISPFYADAAAAANIFIYTHASRRRDGHGFSHDTPLFPYAVAGCLRATIGDEMDTPLLAGH